MPSLISQLNDLSVSVSSLRYVRILLASQQIVGYTLITDDDFQALDENSTYQVPSTRCLEFDDLEKVINFCVQQKLTLDGAVEIYL
jgi:hypothetical protein